MKVTKNIARQVRRGLYAVAIVPALMLTACGDKETPIEPSHRSELAEARAATEREMAGRRLAEAHQREAEDRLGKVLWLAVLGGGAALALGLAVGSSRGRREGAGRDPSTRLRLGVDGADE